MSPKAWSSISYSLYTLISRLICKMWVHIFSNSWLWILYNARANCHAALQVSRENWTWKSYRWQAPEAAPGSPRSWNFSSPMKSSLGSVSENERKTKPDQVEATTVAFTFNNQNNNAPSSAPKRKEATPSLGRWDWGSQLGKLLGSSSQLGLVFQISDLLSLHWSCSYVPENLFRKYIPTHS